MFLRFDNKKYCRNRSMDRCPLHICVYEYLSAYPNNKKKLLRHPHLITPTYTQQNKNCYTTGR